MKGKIRKIVKYPDSRLKTVCKKVDEFDDKTEQTVQDLKETAKHHSALGLAAPQIGSNKRIVVVQIGNIYKPFINPEIVDVDDERIGDTEACLSIDNSERYIYRKAVVGVKYNTVKGQDKFSQYGKETSRTVQHELDHLDGYLINDVNGFTPICAECVKKKGGDTVEGHAATMHSDVCPFCNKTKTLAAVNDFKWPDNNYLTD